MSTNPFDIEFDGPITIKAAFAPEKAWLEWRFGHKDKTVCLRFIGPPDRILAALDDSLAATVKWRQP